MTILIFFTINISVQAQYYTNTNYIYELVGNDSIVYCATNGGLVLYDYERGTYTILTSTDGLLINRHNCIGVDGSGYVWAGCALGLAVVDPSFSNVYIYPDNQLPASTIQDVVCRGDSVYVGTSGGFLIIETNGTPVDFTDDITLPVYDLNVRTIAFEDTFVWVGTDDGLARFSGNFSASTLYTTANGLLDNFINKITVVDTAVYVGTDQGLNRFRGDYFDTLLFNHEVKDISFAGDSLFLALEATSQIGVYHQGSLIITNSGLPTNCRVLSLSNVEGTIFCGLANRYSKDYYGEGIGRYDFVSETWDVTKNQCLPSNHITDITTNDSGVFVACGRKANESRGFGWLNNNGVWTNFSSDSILPSNHVHRCTTSPDNKVWFGFNSFPSDTSSVMIFSFNPVNNEWNFIHVGYKNMERTDAVWDIKFDNNCNMYLQIGRPSDKLWVIDSTLSTVYWLVPFQPGYFIEIAIDSIGKIWRTMAGAGLVMTDTKNTLFDRSDDDFHWYTTSDGLVSNYTRGCIVDRKGDLYVATGGGLARFDGTMFSSITNISDEDLFDVEIDSEGRVWVLARDGVYCYDPDYTIISGWTFSDLNVHIEFLEVSSEIIQVQGFEFDPIQGCLWLGGETGLLKLVVQFDTLPGLDDALVYPNPVVGKNVVRIKNISLDARVYIYSISGRLVADGLLPDPVFGEVVWDIPDDVGSGLYFALIKTDQGNKVCKFAIVR